MIVVIPSHHFERNSWAFQMSFIVGENTHTGTAKLPALQTGWRDTDNNHYYKLSGVTSPSSNLSSQHLAKN